MYKIILSLLLLICLSITTLFAQKKTVTISGYVKEKKSQELLIGVNIYIPGTQIGTTTNSYGFYSLSLPPQKLKLTYSYIGFKSILLDFNLSKDTTINIGLENAGELSGVEVVANSENQISDDVEMSVVTVPVKQIKDIPAFLGEKDVFKVLQLMPGVRSGSEGSSGLYVRGGGPDQNLIILDDAPVYNANHLFGFFSVFNGDAIKSVELTKGGFPARYGGRLSSVIDINMKDGNKTKFGGEAGIGLISSRLVLEGPIVKNKSSFLISARRTYIDVLTQPIIKMIDESTSGGYYFYDLNAKLNYDFGDKNKLFISGYFGRDKAYINIDESYQTDIYKMKNGLYWQNATATVRWNHKFNSKTFANTSFIYSKYKFNIFAQEKTNQNTFELNYYSGIEDFTLKYDMSYIPNPSHYIRYGGVFTNHTFTPGAFVFKDTYSNINESKINKIYNMESAIYFEDEMKIKARTKLNAGFRVSHFNHKAKHYFHFEPRILASYMLKEDMSLKASYTVMNQNIHLLSNTGINLPIDLWVPATDDIGPQKSQQVALGFAKDFLKNGFALSAEVYYKTMDDIIAYREGASFLIDEDLEQNTGFNYENSVTTGNGFSTGLELLLQKKYGKLTGWIGYTLAFTQYKFEELNNGKAFFPRHDRRHDISIVGIYEINKKVTISATWVYGTGDAVSLPQSTFQVYPYNEQFFEMLGYSGGWVNYASNYGDRNSFRYAPYHRLDIGVQVKKKKKYYEQVWEFSVYNAYNRKNPFMYYVGYDYNTMGSSYPKLKQISLFPFIPSVSYNIKF